MSRNASFVETPGASGGSNWKGRDRKGEGTGDYKITVRHMPSNVFQGRERFDGKGG